MISARIILAAVAASLAVPAAAAVEQPFELAAFEAAQAAGRPILVDVAAWWCPVCASQGGTLKQAFTDPHYDKLIVFKINYDKQKAEWKSFGV